MRNQSSIFVISFCLSRLPILVSTVEVINLGYTLEFDHDVETKTVVFGDAEDAPVRLLFQARHLKR